MKFSFSWKGSAFKCRGTGVYLIINLNSGKVYVGSAARSIYLRCHDHRGALRAGRHINIHLSRSWLKHGEGAFIFVVAEECLPEDCVAREQHWMDRLKRKGYKLFNRVPKAGSVLGMKHSEETKRRLSELTIKQFSKPGAREEFAAKVRGRKQSEEEKRKRGAAIAAVWRKHPERHVRWSAAERERIGRQHRGLKFSEESRAKCRESQRRYLSDPANRLKKAEALRRAHLGRKRPPGTGEKIRQALLGKKRSPSVLANIRAARLQRALDRVAFVGGAAYG